MTTKQLTTETHPTQSYNWLLNVLTLLLILMSKIYRLHTLCCVVAWVIHNKRREKYLRIKVNHNNIHCVAPPRNSALSVTNLLQVNWSALSLVRAVFNNCVIHGTDEKIQLLQFCCLCTYFNV